MPELEQLCVDILINDLDSTYTCKLIEFAVKHSVKLLLLAVLDRVQSGAIKVTAMRNYLGDSEKCDSNESKDE
ncbi:hypothetical protein PYW08_005471 [Mythimna loreyi]|uniref:Uncharacterized protein n=1 Tax=Mythimna loreyi TaxID=667449 RepID=A0ACC2QJD1_9NEOP|nr:hypothetical protein PYW08_005471 [Mythimna loreyi]